MTNPKEAPVHKGVSAGMLFLIGLSGGFISAVFPRLITFLTVSSERTEIFSRDFFVVAAFFGLIIGVSMYWLYLDTKESESSKNLFMAALALPSILSGGMNMANSTQAGQSQIVELSSKNRMLEQRLSEALNVPTLPYVSFDDSENISSNSGDDDWMGPSAAHAGFQFAEGDTRQQFSPGVKFNIPEDQRDHVIVLAIVPSEAEAKDGVQRYQSEMQLPDLVIRQAKDQYYVILATPLSRSDALMRADEIRKQHPQLTPKLLQVKPKN